VKGWWSVFVTGGGVADLGYVGLRGFCSQLHTKTYLPSYPYVVSTVSVVLVLFSLLGMMSHLSVDPALSSNIHSSPLERRAKQWVVPGLDKPVSIWIDNTIRYQLSDPSSSSEFSKLVPSSGPTIKLPPFSPSTDSPSSSEGDPDSQIHTVSLFHQLTCLGIIRSDYASNRSTSLSQHCLNYLRQSVLCLADTRLEPVRRAKPPNVVILAGDYECKDWTALYEAAEMSQ